jgi:hypothetical protein
MVVRQSCILAKPAAQRDRSRERRPFNALLLLAEADSGSAHRASCAAGCRWRVKGLSNGVPISIGWTATSHRRLDAGGLLLSSEAFGKDSAVWRSATATMTRSRTSHSAVTAALRRPTPVGSAPLRSGFVEDIKAKGPQIYAHEIFVLNGALPNAGYRVTRNFLAQDPRCGGNLAFHDDAATLTTNVAGNAHGDIFITPEQITPGSEGVHGVSWTVRDAAGAVIYKPTASP